MNLDSWMIRRLAAELDRALAGARIRMLASDPAGLTLWCYSRGKTLALRAALDPNAPLLAAIGEDGGAKPRPQNEKGAGGWAGGVASLLRGCVVESVQAVPNDRIIYVDVISRSAFGVPSRHRVTYELQPRKTNALVLRPATGARWHVLAAAKQIRAEGHGRDVVVGAEYAPPPPRVQRLNATEFAAAANTADGSDVRAVTALLEAWDPACTPPLAREVAKVAAESRSGIPLAQRLIDAWQALRECVAAAADELRSPVFCWQRGASDSEAAKSHSSISHSAISLCHLIPLTWPSGTPSQVDSLNALCAAAIASGEEAALAPRLAAVRKRLQALIDRCDRETAALHRAQAEAQEADRFRIAGESIYAYLRDIPERADHFVTPEGARVALDPSMDAKQNAAAYFRRFKKARRGLPNIAQRLRVLETNRSFWESLAWEAERIHSHGGEDAEVVLEEIETAAGVRRKAAQPRRRPQRVERTVPLSGGAIAYIGRSPRDNERLTFSVAGPNDLWFHTRGMPGAHVVLKLSGATQPTEKQIVEAASLAAGHSRAANAAKVEVDYTQRKHVRRQGGGRPGLVWYTDFHTVLVAPRKL